MYIQTLEEAYTMVCMFTSNSVKKNVPSKELPTKVCPLLSGHNNASMFDPIPSVCVCPKLIDQICSKQARSRIITTKTQSTKFKDHFQ